MNIDAVERFHVTGGHLEEGELVALEIGADEMAESRDRLEPARVKQLDQNIGIAIRFAVRAIGRVQRMRDVDGRLGVHPQRTLRTSAGHELGSKPCLRRSATVQRSKPNPRHAVCASPPPSIAM